MLSIYLSVCLSIYLYIYLSVCLSIYLPIYLSPSRVARARNSQDGVRIHEACPTGSHSCTKAHAVITVVHACPTAPIFARHLRGVACTLLLCLFAVSVRPHARAHWWRVCVWRLELWTGRGQALRVLGQGLV